MKRYLKTIRYIITATALFVSTACNQFLDVNESPNNLEDSPPMSTLLSSAQAGTAFASSNELNRFSSTIMSVIAGVANLSARWDIYNMDGGDFGLQWNRELYGGALINYQKLLQQAEAAHDGPYLGVGKIMLAYTFALITDAWGDIPYAEALMGDHGQFTPGMDTQRDIYLGNAAKGIQSLFDLVREGLANLDAPGSTPMGAADLIYGGNLDHWRRAGHALLLKLAMQISAIEPELARQIIQQEVNKGMYIMENNQSMRFYFGAQVGSQSPLWTQSRNSVFRNDFMISTRFVTLLQRYNDPRLPLYVTRPTAEYVTIDNGFRGAPPAVATRSIYNSYAVGNNGEGPTRLISNAQVAFILAEAILKWGVTAGDAEEQYQRGIRASMQEAGLTNSVIDQYLAENPQVSTLAGSVDTQVEQIITQKYIALYSNGLEQWNDWRRTGYPVLAEHQNAAGIDGTRPRRLVYLFTEQQRNHHFPQGSDVPQSNIPVWWDVN